MIYLQTFNFAAPHNEDVFLGERYPNTKDGSRYFENCYPFGLFPEKGFEKIDFEPITIFYGDNGSGKSTALNVIARKLHVDRKSVYNDSELMDDYCSLCTYVTDMRWCGEEYDVTGRRTENDISNVAHMITSDDIFKSLLADRVQRDQFLLKSKMLQNQAQTLLEGGWGSMNEFGNLSFDCEDPRLEAQGKIRRQAKGRRGITGYLENTLGKQEHGISNGENSFVYISNMMKDEGLYLLDEPENSLSPAMQFKLAELLLYMARYNNCQIILATHSPFLLSIPFAKIYNLDMNPVGISKFEELPSTHMYYNFFKSMSERIEAAKSAK